MNHSLVDYAKGGEGDEFDFIVIALSKFGKLVAVAEAAKKLVENTASSAGFVHIPPANFFFDLEDKLFDLETK